MTANLHIVEEKKRLRKAIRERKALLSAEDFELKSEAIFAQVEQLPQFIQSTCVFGYMALADEVQTAKFLRKWVGKKTIVLPIVKGDDLELREFTLDGSLQLGESFGVLEPHSGRLVSADEIDFAVIPGVAFDRANNRMGRGKGYYDKLLSEANFFKIGVCFDFQLVENVPVDVFDKKMDGVIIA